MSTGSADDVGGKGRLFRFRRNKKKQNNNSRRPASVKSFDDDMESLGMESGSGDQNRRRRNRGGRFRLRNNFSSNDSGEAPPIMIGAPPCEVITATPMPVRPRSNSLGDVSFDLSGPESDHHHAVHSADELELEYSSEPRSGLLGLRRRLVGIASRRPRSEPPDGAASASEVVASIETASDVSSLQQNGPRQVSRETNRDSFDSSDGDMLSHVRARIALPSSYKSKKRPGAKLRFDPALGTVGMSGEATNDQQKSHMDSPDLPVKRISFDQSAGVSPSEELTSHRPMDFTPSSKYNEGSSTTQSTAGSSTQTYRSMGGADTYSHRAAYTGSVTSRQVRKKFRVRPYHCFSQPVQMTEEEIYIDSTTPSLHWEMLKSYLAPSSDSHRNQRVRDDIVGKYGSCAEDGRIGSLRCEVLGCVSLPRKSKPDVCVYLICGDTAFCTDIIEGYRSPMWPSASRRACVFPIHHAYTRLYAGVFDVRARKNKENDVFCGRVCLDVASMRPNTEYDVTFPLRASSFVYDKHKRGVLRMRYSLHWFSERGAVLSYFSRPHTFDKSSPLVQGSPTIPCADPKTFRNVAVTVHGNDLPGKYSRTAFKATVREFQLYQLNLRFMLYYLLIDTIMYEKPYISLYLFLAGLHCVITESVSKVPPYLMGFLIILFLENYKHYVADTLYNEGYQQLTILEIFKALVSKTGSEDKYFEPILVAKRAKKIETKKTARVIRRSDSPSISRNGDMDGENILLDHKEFPFSDRQAYPKFAVENALAPSSSKKGGSNTRLHGRLSVYYAPTTSDENGDSEGEEEEESSDDSDGNETIIEGSGMFDHAFDDVEDDDMTGDVPDSHTSNQYGYGDSNAYGYGDGNHSTGNTQARKLKFFTQNIDDSGGAPVPPQVTVKRMENLFHKFSRSLAVEKVVAPPTKEHIESALIDGGKNEKLALTTEDIAKEIEMKRKAYLDEFDKLLGLQAKSSNPFSKMFATFLGPLMRILRIPIFIVRIGFNATTWRDPYLSFWLFCAMCATLLILMAFPWRLFFFMVTLIGLGPQNIFLRRFLENRAKKSAEEMESQQIAAVGENATNITTDTGGRKNAAEDADSGSVKSEVRRFFGRRKNRNKAGPPVEIGSEVVSSVDRPPFSSAGQNNRKQLRPRSVVVPYSKLRKERFYDWPPDPQVSKATPIELERWPQEIPEEVMAPEPELDEYYDEEQEEVDAVEITGPRRRRLSGGSDSIPIPPASRKRRGSL